MGGNILTDNGNAFTIKDLASVLKTGERRASLPDENNMFRSRPQVSPPTGIGIGEEGDHLVVLRVGVLLRRPAQGCMARVALDVGHRTDASIEGCEGRRCA